MRFLYMPWATDAMLLTFAWVGLLVIVGTVATLSTVGARTIVRNRRKRANALRDRERAAALDPFHARDPFGILTR